MISFTLMFKHCCATVWTLRSVVRGGIYTLLSPHGTSVNTTDTAMLGVVVVGIGRAGSTRIKDFTEASKWDQTKHVKLIGFVSRRHLELEGTKQITLEEALSRDDVHVIVVATENKTHYEITKKSIEAGKHVLVEFPLATNADDVIELQTLAKKKGVLCHEEVISLLLDSHKEVKEMTKLRHPLKEGYIDFLASYNGWIEDFEGSGSPFTSGMSHLHGMYDLFGDLTPVKASLTREDAGYVCIGTVHTEDNKPITFKTTRTKEKGQRSIKMKLVFEDGSEIDGIPPATPKDGPGLYMRDFIQFLGKMEKGSSVLPSPEGTLHCHQVADALYKLTQDKA